MSNQWRDDRRGYREWEDRKLQSSKRDDDDFDHHDWRITPSPTLAMGKARGRERAWKEFMIISRNVGSINSLTAVRTRNKDNEDDETGQGMIKMSRANELSWSTSEEQRSEKIVQKLGSHKQDINTFTLFNRFLREHLSERDSKKERRKRENQ